MGIIFKPTGSLDVNTEPSALEEQALGNDTLSGAMTRCKNLRLDQHGLAQLRFGSSRLGDTVIPIVAGHIVEQGGDRYVFGTSIYKNGSSIGSGYNNANWDSILYNTYNSSNENIFALNGYDTKRIEDGVVYAWGLEAPDQTFTLSAGTSTGLTGTYNAKFSFVRKEGDVVVYESNAGDAGTAVTLANNSLRVTFSYEDFVTVDASVTHLRFYRTLAGGNTYYLDSTVKAPTIYEYSYTSTFELDDAYISGDSKNIATEHCKLGIYAIFTWEASYGTTGLLDASIVSTGYSVESVVYELSTADGSLGAIPPTDHNPPPAGAVVIGPNFDGYSFILKDNKVYFSIAKQPEYWPSGYYVEVSPSQYPLKAACFYNGQLYVATQYKIYAITGTGATTFFPVPQSTITGAEGRYAMWAIDGVGIYHIGTDGIYLFSAYGDHKITSNNFDVVFRGNTTNGVPGVGSTSNAWIIQFKNKVYFAYAGTSNTYPRNVLVYDSETKKIVYYDWTNEIPAVCVDYENDRLLAIASNGYTYVLEDESVTTDDSAAIAWEIQSKDYTLTTRAHFPRTVKYDVDAASATSAYGYLLLDGVVHQTHTLTANRSPKRRLVVTGTGYRCALRLSGSGPIEIYAVESE